MITVFLNPCLLNPSVVLRINIDTRHAERHIALLFRYYPEVPEPKPVDPYRLNSG